MNMTSYAASSNDTWDSVPFTKAFTFSRGLDIKKQDLSDHGLPVISYGQIHAKDNPGVELLDKHLRYIPEEFVREAQLGRAQLRAGDVVFADTSEDVAGAGNLVRISEGQAVYAGYHTLVARPTTGFSQRYMAYQMISDVFRRQLQREVQGVKVFSVTQRIFHRVTLLIPPPGEQQQIASFLDAKTAEIDGLISKLERERELLERYRRQFAWSVLTTGCATTAPTVDSGVDWIGHMPATWSTVPARRLFEVVKRIEPGFSDQVLSITQRGIVPKDLDSHFGQIAESYDAYQRVDAGDFAMNAMDLLTGWVDLSKFSGVTSPDYRVFRLRTTIAADPRYFTHVLQMGYTRRIFYRFGQGVSNLGRWRLQPKVFLNMKFPLPPIEEQVAIANLIDEKYAELDSTVAGIDRQIELLGRYRKQVINDAVTGKVRVGGVA